MPLEEAHLPEAVCLAPYLLTGQMRRSEAIPR